MTFWTAIKLTSKLISESFVQYQFALFFDNRSFIDKIDKYCVFVALFVYFIMFIVDRSLTIVMYTYIMKPNEKSI